MRAHYRYELDMSKPYDYMVARTLLDIANKSDGFEFTSVEFTAGEVSLAYPANLFGMVVGGEYPR